jgi:transposase
MKAKPEVIALDIGKLEALLERIQADLGEDVAAPFRELLHCYAQLVEILGNQEISLRRLQQLLFGVKTERTSNVLGPDHASTAEGVAAVEKGEAGDGAGGSSAASTPEEGTSRGEGSGQDNGTGAPCPRKGHGRNGASAYPGCKKVAVPHGWLSAGDACPNCDGGKLYVQTAPARRVRLVGQAPVGGTVYEFQRLRCHLCGEVFTAETTEEVGDQKYDATAVSMMAMMRYGQGMAGNRLAGLQQSMGIPLPASTQWEVVSSGAESIVPVFQYLILTAAQGDVVHNDDTTMRVLELMDEETRRQVLQDGDPDRRGIFTSGIVSIGNGHSIALFFTGPRHAGENLREVLAQRAEELAPPIQMCDALSRNMPEDLHVILGNCLSHGRRRFFEVAEAFPEQVIHVLEALKRVYQVDAEAKEQQLSPQDRWLLHQQRSGPVMETLHQWLTEQFEQKQVEPNSSLGQCIAYMLRHWKELTLFLRQPGAPLDNNICERALKKAILHRKNSLFYKTRRGAYVGDLYMSLIQTCLLCGADPFDYLTQLLCNHEQAARAPGQWMPWNYQAQVALARAGPAELRGSPSSADS